MQTPRVSEENGPGVPMDIGRLSAIASASGPICPEKAARMRSISAFSFSSHCFISLPASTTAIGSMNSVEPVPD